MVSITMSAFSPSVLRLAPLLFAVACGSGTGGDITGGGGGGEGADGGGGPGGVDDECHQVEPIQMATGDPADLLLVVDKSGSMDDPLGTGERKWPVMRDALTTVVEQYQNGIRFGLMLYPNDGECAAGSVRAPMGIGNAGAITGELGNTSPDGGTPTHTTLAAAGSYYAGVTSPGDRYVLLATDGEPNCGDLADSEAPTVTESIDAITSLRGSNIMTFVLGFGGSVNNHPDTLQAMADAGGTGDYFAANSPAELAAALGAIASEVGLPSCSFRLERTPMSGSDLIVYQDDQMVSQDPSHQSGWDWDPGTNTLTFYGSDCDAILGGQTDSVTIQFGGCGEVE
jgi:Mg-chelatase subunit ChlD